MTTLEILGIEIPSELQTRTIASTNWALIPIRDVTSLDRTWIGKRRSQLSATLLDFVLEQNHTDLLQRKNIAVKSVRYVFEIDITGDERVRKEELLGQLRYLWLIECLLAQS